MVEKGRHPEIEDVYEWLDVVGANYDQQQKFASLPQFPSYELLEESSESLSLYNHLVSKEKIKPGTRTNLSQIETIYPWLLQKEGVIENLSEYSKSNQIRSEEMEKAALYGTKLHQADVLFSLVTQISNGRQSMPIEQFLPTERNEQLLSQLRSAVYNVGYGNIKNIEDLEHRLLKAWTNYHLLSEPENIAAKKSGIVFNLPLENFGMHDPRKTRDTWVNKELGEIGARLAKAHAREFYNEESALWCFHPDGLTQKEVMISLNFRTCKLSFNIRIDSITRMWDSNRKKVQAQTVNLKTGVKRELQGIEAEIKKRQNQIELIAAESFVNKYMRGDVDKRIKSLTPAEKGSFYMGVNSDSSGLEKRFNLAGNLWFNQGSGEFELESFSMTPEERKEFFTWLVWYGNLINLYKQDVKKVVARKPAWNLKNVQSNSERFIIPELQPEGYV